MKPAEEKTQALQLELIHAQFKTLKEAHHEPRLYCTAYYPEKLHPYQTPLYQSEQLNELLEQSQADAPDGYLEIKLFTHERQAEDLPFATYTIAFGNAAHKQNSYEDFLKTQLYALWQEQIKTLNIAKNLQEETTTLQTRHKKAKTKAKHYKLLFIKTLHSKTYETLSFIFEKLGIAKEVLDCPIDPKQGQDLLVILLLFFADHQNIASTKEHLFQKPEVHALIEKIKTLSQPQEGGRHE